MALTISIYNARDERQEPNAYVVFLELTEFRYYDQNRIFALVGICPSKATGTGLDQSPFKTLWVDLPLDVTQPRTDLLLYTQLLALGDYGGVDFTTASLYVDPVE